VLFVRILRNADFVVKCEVIGGILWWVLEQSIVNSIGWLGLTLFGNLEDNMSVSACYGYGFCMTSILLSKMRL